MVPCPHRGRRRRASRLPRGSSPPGARALGGAKHPREASTLPQAVISGSPSPGWALPAATPRRRHTLRARPHSRRRTTRPLHANLTSPLLSNAGDGHRVAPPDRSGGEEAGSAHGRVRFAPSSPRCAIGPGPPSAIPPRHRRTPSAALPRRRLPRRLPGFRRSAQATAREGREAVGSRGGGAREPPRSPCGSDAGGGGGVLPRSSYSGRVLTVCWNVLQLVPAA